ncbi:hypothetical protein N6H18_10220 [Reichenbachiella agarivorans]|uniref:Uncharacterized protein n=1 Tax=Reichenbachiella agarivorans TaxID=2979464 RepID=A0ABY6CJM8_9BACT|nr:hypothetical protein [Reichenbachiella agarivorans]UXP30727.1 hypothetical protein N6H18_10220 [Reichenbachiella agarivorans]
MKHIPLFTQFLVTERLSPYPTWRSTRYVPTIRLTAQFSYILQKAFNKILALLT